MIRIVAGEWRGRRIPTPPGRGTRPTSEKVRGAIFNMLHARAAIDEAEVWDLFAGSGAMGIEALSRGARCVRFVESDARAASLIRDTLKSLQAAPERWSVSASRVETWLEQVPPPAYPLIVLIDPPYAAEAGAALLSRLARLESVTPGSLIVLESAAHAGPGVPPGLELVQVKRYGGTGVQVMMKGGFAAGPDAGIERGEEENGDERDA